MVARGTHVVGTIELTDSFHLDGFMKGTIRSENDVSIGQSGSFEGEVQARRILVSGEFDGKLDAERLEIVASGRVTGEITVSELVIESGGQFSGSSHIKGGRPEPHLLDYQEAAAENGSR